MKSRPDRTRLLITGNSNVGALKLGWDHIAPQWQDRVALDFFAMPERYFSTFDFADDNRFGAVRPDPEEPQTEAFTQDFNGRTTVSLDEYDHVLVAGHKFQFMSFMQSVRRFDIEDLLEWGGNHLMSAACFEAFARGFIGSLLPPAGWFTQRRTAVSFIAQPRPSAEIADPAVNPKVPMPYTLIQEQPGVLGPLRDLYEDWTGDIFRQGGVGFIRQPADTLTKEGLTEPRFARDALRLTEDRFYEETNFRHMNRDFGTIMLGAALETACGPALSKGVRRAG